MMYFGVQRRQEDEEMVAALQNILDERLDQMDQKTALVDELKRAKDSEETMAEEGETKRAQQRKILALGHQIGRQVAEMDRWEAERKGELEQLWNGYQAMAASDGTEGTPFDATMNDVHWQYVQAEVGWEWEKRLLGRQIDTDMQRLFNVFLIR